MGQVMLFGPQQVISTDKERAGLIMNFHLMGGICVATAIAAFAMNHIPTEFES
jgi:hypothetical protein